MWATRRRAQRAIIKNSFLELLRKVQRAHISGGFFLWWENSFRSHKSLSLSQAKKHMRKNNVYMAKESVSLDCWNVKERVKLACAMCAMCILRMVIESESPNMFFVVASHKSQSFCYTDEDSKKKDSNSNSNDCRTSESRRHTQSQYKSANWTRSIETEKNF